jgi:hypothetical protein
MKVFFEKVTSMKKTVTALIIMLVLATFALPVIAAKEDSGGHSDDTVTTEKTRTVSPAETERKHGADDTVTATMTTRSAREQERHGTEIETEDDHKTSGRNISEIRREHDKSHDDLNATLRNVSSGDRERFKNENEVRLAVHTLLEMENVSGGIGRNVSAIAREFNNSASSAKTFEDRIRNRNTLTRILFGGDRDAAREIANLTARNRDRILELEQLLKGSSLDTDSRAFMEDQVRIMQKEQERLDQLSKREQEDRGFFAWFG